MVPQQICFGNIAHPGDIAVVTSGDPGARLIPKTVHSSASWGFLQSQRKLTVNASASRDAAYVFYALRSQLAARDLQSLTKRGRTSALISVSSSG